MNQNFDEDFYLCVWYSDRTLMDQQTIRAFESTIINCVLTTSYRQRRRSIFYQHYLAVPQVLSLKELIYRSSPASS